MSGIRPEHSPLSLKGRARHTGTGSLEIRAVLFRFQKSICLIHALSIYCVPTVCCAEDVMVDKTRPQT